MPILRFLLAAAILTPLMGAAPLVENPQAAWIPSEGAKVEAIEGGIRVTVAKKGEKPWSIRLSVGLKRAIAKGENVRIAFTVRRVKSDDGKLRAFLKFQLSKSPFDPLAQRSVEGGPQDLPIELNWVADRELAPGQANLDLHLGAQAQSFELVQFTMESAAKAASAAFETRQEKPLKASGSVGASTLKEAWGKSFAVGAAIPGPELNDAERALLVRHFTTVTPENVMKPSLIHPAEDRYAFEKADALVDFALSKGLTVNGHTLVWHSQCPDWFFIDGGQRASKEKVLERMKAHIATVVGRYKGRVKSWDVVNEAIDDAPPFLRDSKWFQACGEDFIVEAFKAAKQADPAAELYYNDYNIETPAKRAKTVRLIQMLKDRGATIDGVGIQGHWGGVKGAPLASIEKAIQEFSAEGVKVMITELDLDMVPRSTQTAEANAREGGTEDPYAAGLPEEMQARLGENYAALFRLFRKYPDAVSRVTFWGLHDGRSWLNGWPRKRTNHPLLWARDLSPKPALQAVLDAAAASD